MSQNVQEMCWASNPSPTLQRTIARRKEGADHLARGASKANVAPRCMFQKARRGFIYVPFLRPFGQVPGQGKATYIYV